MVLQPSGEATLVRMAVPAGGVRLVTTLRRRVWHNGQVEDKVVATAGPHLANCSDDVFGLVFFGSLQSHKNRKGKAIFFLLVTFRDNRKFTPLIL